MRHPLMLLPVAALLAGCSAATPQAAPTIPAGPASAATGDVPTASATPAAASRAEGCQAPNDAVMAWLHANGSPVLDPAEVAMVDAGEGNTPGSDWWVVAAPSYGFHAAASPSAVERTNMYPVTWLTDAGATPPGTTWISLYSGDQVDASGVYSATKDWSNVTWTGDRLARGQQAQDKAIACLGA